MSWILTLTSNLVKVSKQGLDVVRISNSGRWGGQKSSSARCIEFSIALLEFVGMVYLISFAFKELKTH